MTRVKSDRMRYLVFLMKAGGLWLNFSDHRHGWLLTLFQLACYLYLLAGFLMLLNLVVSGGLQYMLSPSAVFVTLATEVTISSTLVLFKMGEIEKLIRQCDKNLCSYHEPWERRMIDEDTKRVTYFSNMVKYGFTYYAIFYCSFPIIINAYRIIVGNPQRYSQPLIFDGYLDESTERNLNFYTFTFMSYIWIIIGIPNTVSYESCIFYTMSTATTELNIVKRYVQLLRSEGNTSDWDLSHIIKKHSQILRITRLQNRSIALPTFFSCRITFTCVICFTLYFTLMHIGKDTSLVIFAIVFTLAMYLLGFVLCSTGQYLENQSEQLYDQVTSLPWYLQSVKSRKNYLMLLRQTSKTLVFDYAYITSLNLRCFLQIVNNSFSYLMIIKSLGQAEIGQQ